MLSSFGISIPSSLDMEEDVAFWAVAALLLLLPPLAAAVRHVVAGDKSPVALALGASSKSKRASYTSGGSMTRSGVEPLGPAPPYLAGADGALDDVASAIGGDPRFLPSPPRGPTASVVTFRAYAPPSLDREIPKIDLYGAADFVRTGRVRMAPDAGGVRRLLAIDYEAQTLRVYHPKRARGGDRGGKGSARRGHGRDSIFAEGGAEGHGPLRRGSQSSTGGINISASRLDVPNDEDEDSTLEDEMEDEEAWSARNFRTSPTLRIHLRDLVSVVAVPPRHGGVVEITSRSGGPSCGGASPTKDPLEAYETPTAKVGKRASVNVPMSRKRASVNGPRSRRRASTASVTQSIKVPMEREEEGDDEESESEYVSRILSPAGDINGAPPAKIRRDEFAFTSPRDAAEFQRTILAIRTAGREMTCLYEALAIAGARGEVSAENEEEGDKAGDSKEATGEASAQRSAFAPPGVTQDDVRQCLGEIPSLRRGLDRLCRDPLYPLDDVVNRGILDDDLCGEDEDASSRPLGLVDFVSLFVPPLPPAEDRPDVLPRLAPCAGSEYALEGSTDLPLASGIERHYQTLGFVLALQRLVSRAALHVRAYAWARLISRGGWDLEDKDEDENDGELSREGVVEDGFVGDRSIMVQRPLSASSRGRDDDVVRERWGIGAGVDDPSTSSMSYDQQGYSRVGWHAVRTTCPLDEESNPLQRFSSLRAVVKRFPYSHFFLFSHYNHHRSIGVHFLLVRSLPVGVDRAFDDAVRNFVSSCEGKERDQRFGIAVQVGPAKNSSFLTKVALGALRVLCHRLNILATRFYHGKARKGERVFLAEPLTSMMTSMRHYGGSLDDGSSGLPPNWVAVTSYFALSKFPTALGRWLLRITKLSLKKTSVVDCSFELRAYSKLGFPGRAIASAGVANLDVNKFVTSTMFNDGVNVARRNCQETNAKNPDGDEDGSERDINDHSQKNGVHHDKVRAIYELLEVMAVPQRRTDRTRGEHNSLSEIFTMDQVHLRVTRSDIERYLIANNNDLKTTVVRIVESVAWRNVMFPIDTRTCRIELQSGQFFHQGHDKAGNPIFYFRRFLQGPWRCNMHATILSILHRLEAFLSKVGHEAAKLTLIALMDHPLETDDKKGRASKEDQRATTIGSDSFVSVDPRIDPFEEWQKHLNLAVMQVLGELIPRHYPGRLAKLLVVSKWKKSLRRLSLLLPSSFAPLFAHAKNVSYLSSIEDLTSHVDQNELVVFAGGNARVSSGAFSCDISFDHVDS
ncbi:hypothetical protein ACHAWF_013305 [Thalassiosira exigua]